MIAGYRWWFCRWLMRPIWGPLILSQLGQTFPSGRGRSVLLSQTAMRSFLLSSFSISCCLCWVSKCWDPCHKVLLHFSWLSAWVSHTFMLMLHFFMLALRVFLEHLFCPPLMCWPWLSCENMTCFGSWLSGSQRACPDKQSWWWMTVASVLEVLAWYRMLLLVCQSFHFLWKILWRHRWWYHSRALRCVLYMTQVSAPYRREGIMMAWYRRSLVSFLVS